MKSFKEYFKEVQEQPKQKYIALYCDEETSQKLREWCDSNGFDLTKSYDGKELEPGEFKFHSTIWHTTSKHHLENGKTKITPVRAEIKSFECLGENNDIPVLKLKSDELVELREKYQSEYNMEDQWPDYKPHVSLSYDRRDYTDELNRLTLPDFDVYYDTLVIDDIQEDS